MKNIKKLTEKGKAAIVKAIKSNDSLLYFCIDITAGPLFKQMLRGLPQNRASFVKKCNRILEGQQITLWDKEKTFLQCHSIIDAVQSRADVMLPNQKMEDLANLCIPKLQLEYDALLMNNLMLIMPQSLSNIVMEYVREDNPLWYVYFSNGTTQTAYDISHNNENSDSLHAGSQNNDGGAQDSMSIATPEQHDSNPEADQDFELDSYYQFQQGDPTEGSYIENLLTTIFTWIKDLPEDLQQRIFSSVMEQLYKMLESIEQPNKAVTDQLNSQPIEKIFEIAHSEYHNQNVFISSSQQYAQPYKSDDLISMDMLLGPVLSSGIFIEPLQNSTPHFFGSMASY